MGYANGEGMIWIVDRKKDMINRGGEKVWCSALEEVLCEIPGISEACACGMPDDLYGEVPVAVCVRQTGSNLTEGEIKTALKSRLAHFKIPVHIAFANEIPQTRGEKPDRRAALDLYSNRSRKRHLERLDSWLAGTFEQTLSLQRKRLHPLQTIRQSVPLA